MPIVAWTYQHPDRWEDKWEFFHTYQEAVKRYNEVLENEEPYSILIASIERSTDYDREVNGQEEQNEV